MAKKPKRAASRRPKTKKELDRMARFGKAVAKLRGQLSQSDLARRAGVTPAAIWRIERGERDVTLSTIWMLAEALGLSPAVLVEAADD